MLGNRLDLFELSHIESLFGRDLAKRYLTGADGRRLPMGSPLDPHAEHAPNRWVAILRMVRMIAPMMWLMAVRRSKGYALAVLQVAATSASAIDV